MARPKSTGKGLAMSSDNADVVWVVTKITPDIWCEFFLQSADDVGMPALLEDIENIIEKFGF